MSPCDRLTCDGTSITCTCAEASTLPAAPCWMRGLCEPLTRPGAQPTSSSRPTWTNRSAFLSWTMYDGFASTKCGSRSEEHTSELQSRRDLVCRLLLEKKKPQPQPHADMNK